MNSRNTISEELASLNSSLPHQLGETYSVPAGYFEGLAASVLARVTAENEMSAHDELSSLSPFLGGLSKEMPFSVPAGYFESGAEGLSALTRQEEESTVLSSIGKQMPFEVPPDYFESFPGIVMKAVEPGAKVIPLFARKWMKMAVAATIAGVLALSAILYMRSNTGTESGDAIAIELKRATTDELNHFLKTTSVSDAPAVVKNAAPVKEAKGMFGDISDKELEAFLDGIPAEELSLNETDLLLN